MKRSSVVSQSKSKNKSIVRCASAGLTQFLKNAYPNKIPIATITGAFKLYGKNRILTKDDKIVKRFT